MGAWTDDSEGRTDDYLCRTDDYLCRTDDCSCRTDDSLCRKDDYLCRTDDYLILGLRQTTWGRKGVGRKVDVRVRVVKGGSKGSGCEDTWLDLLFTRNGI